MNREQELALDLAQALVRIDALKFELAELEVAAKRVIQLWLPTKDRSDTTFGDALHELSEALK